MSENTLNLNIGNNIKKIREKHKETQVQLAEAIHIGQDSISKIELSKQSPSIQTLIDIAAHYKISLDNLCMGAEKNSYLDTLTDYISLSYETCSYAEETYCYPVLSIEKALYRFIQQKAYAESLPVPKEVKEMWLDKEATTFLDSIYKKDSDEKVKLVLVPEAVLCPPEKDVSYVEEEILRRLTQQRNELSDSNN